MTQSASPQETVARLKELLFDRESRELRVLTARLADVSERAGSDDRFQRSVAQVLEGALRDAEASRHRELADAMAPMVLRTLRTEMRSADMQDQIAGLMFPRIGEMVRRYVASAVSDMMQEINRRLEAGLGRNRLMLWLRSRTSGRSMAELALADTQRLEVEEVYLIRRGSGELVHRWERVTDAGADAGTGASGPGTNRDTLVSGFLTAITAFAEEAFEADKASLRTLDLDDHRIYLRGAPSHLLAVKCRGTAPAAVEGLFDGEIIRTLAEHQLVEQRAASDPSAGSGRGVAEAHAHLLGDLAGRLEAGATRISRELSRGQSFRTLRRLALVLGCVLGALLAWHLYISWITRDLQVRAERAVAAVPGLAGYPLKVYVERGARRMWVTGLVPDEAARRGVVSGLKEVAPTVALQSEVAVLPKDCVPGRLMAAQRQRAVDRARVRLAALAADIVSATGLGGDPAEQRALSTALAAARATEVRLAGLDPAAGDDDVAEAMWPSLEALHAATGDIAKLVGSPEAAPLPSVRDGTQAVEWTTQLAERLAELLATGERRRLILPVLRRLEMAAEQAGERMGQLDREASDRVAALDRSIVARLAALEARLAGLVPEPGPRERLEAFVRSNAIFFTNDTDYREPDAARETLEALVPLVGAAKARVRIVGYTDDVGSTARNTALAQARADKVAADLLARGVDRDLVVAVGRLGGVSIAPGKGPDSANRRVEIELGFRNEPRSAP
jgi:outer membrane protein OmpA-like peptidoglycan-associated protein